MTPEQIERLERLLEWFESDCTIEPPPQQEVAEALRVLLAEWEERGREIERLKQQIKAMQETCGGEEVSLRAEVERLSEQLRLCEVPDGWETWRHNAEAEIERLKAKVEGLLNQNQEIASSNADHVRWHREAEARLEKVEEWARTAHAWGYTKPEGYSQGYADAQAFVRNALAAAQPKEG